MLADEPDSPERGEPVGVFFLAIRFSGEARASQSAGTRGAREERQDEKIEAADDWIRVFLTQSLLILWQPRLKRLRATAFHTPHFFALSAASREFPFSTRRPVRFFRPKLCASAIPGNTG